MMNFEKLDVESLKKIEEEVFGGYFECDIIRSSDTSIYNKKYYRTAIKYYSALTKFGDDKEVLLNLAASQFKVKKYENCIQILSNAIQLFPNDIDDAYIPECFRIRAWAYCLNGNYAESIADYTQCKEWDSSPHWRYFRGQAHFYYKHYYDAINDFSEVIRHARSWSAPLFWRAKSYLKLKDYNKAIEDYTLLIEEYGFCSEYSFLQRGKIFNKLGEHDKAKKDFKSAKNIKK